MKKLIDNLLHNHRPQKWWERSHILKRLLFCASLGIIFLSLVFVKKIYFFSSFLFLILLFASALIAWFSFSSLLNSTKTSKQFWRSICASLLAGVILNLMLENYIYQSISHQREISLRVEDGSCFWHTMLIGSIPLIFLFFAFRNFFIPYPRKTIILFSLSTIFSSLVVTEISCPNREWWHLMFGHQSSILGILIVANLIFYFREFQNGQSNTGRSKNNDGRG